MNAAWPKMRLGEVLTPICRQEKVQTGTTYRLLGARWYAGGLFIKDTCDGSGIRAEKVYRVERGDFVYNRLFAWKGSFAVADEVTHGCYVSNEFPCFQINLEQIEPQYLQRYMSRENAWTEALGLSTGGTPTSRNRLKEEKLLGMTIPLPPLSEQRRIVGRIEALAGKIEDAKRLRKVAVEEAEALSLVKLSEIFRQLSDRFGETRLDELVIDAGYGSSEKCQTERMDGGIPVLRIPNVAMERIALHDLKYAPLSEKDRQRLTLLEGDILIVRTNGSLDLVGRCAVVPQFDEPFAFASYMIRLRFDTKRILPDYAQRMLQHLRVAGVLVDYAHTTAGQYNVSLGRLRNAAIPVPPLSDQRRIVAELDGLQAEVDRLKGLQGQTSAELEAMLPSILDRAFKGEL